MTTNPALREVNDHLSNWLLRRRLLEAGRWSLRGLALGLGLALVLSMVARVTPLQPVPVLIGLSVALALTGFGMDKF